MKIGDINVTNSILSLEHDVRVLQHILIYIIENNSNTINVPNQTQVNSFKEKALKELQSKYPNMDVKRN